MASSHDEQIKNELSTLCGTPAFLPGADTRLLLKTDVKNIMRREYQIQTYYVSRPFSHITSDSLAAQVCQEVLSPFDRCDNATDALGVRFDSINIKCRAGGSKTRLHPPCTHPKLSDEKTNKVPEQRERIYRCTVCGQIEKSMIELLQHQRVQHYRLPRVEETKTEKKSVPKLVKSNCNACSSSHILGFYSCNNCRFSSTCPFALEKHMNQVHGSQQVYHCPICDHQHRYYTAMERHLFEKHRENDEATVPRRDDVTNESPGPMNHDDGVGETLTDDEPESTEDEDGTPLEEIRSSMTSPDTTHAQFAFHEPLFCPFCSARFKFETLFRKHVRFHHFERERPNYRCLICGIALQSHLMTLKNHYINVHKKFLPIFLETVMEPIMTFREPVARTKLITKAVRKCVRDLDPNTYRGTFSLDIQCKIIKDKCQVNDIVKVIDDERLWLLTCGICGEGPIYKAAMLEHLVIHTQRWPYACSGCRGMFKRRVEAREHIDVCPAVTATGLVVKTGELREQNQQIVSLLKEHCSNSESSFPGNAADAEQFCFMSEFWCNLCKHNTYSFNEMTTHMLDHVNILPYSCTACRHSYQSRALTQSHITGGRCRGNIKFDKILEFSARELAGKKALEMTTLIYFSASSFNGQDVTMDEGSTQTVLKSEEDDVNWSESESRLTSQQGNTLPVPVTVVDSPPASQTQPRRPVSPRVRDLVIDESDDVNFQATVDEFVSMSSPRKLYRCRNCSKTFAKLHLFTQHATSHCDQMPWTCSECSCSFRSYKGEESFLRHAKHHHPNRQPSSCKLINESELRKQVHCVKQLMNVISVFEGKTNDDDVIVPVSDVTPEVSTKRADKRKQSMDTYTYQSRSIESTRKQPRLSVEISDRLLEASTSQSAPTSIKKTSPESRDIRWTILKPVGGSTSHVIASNSSENSSKSELKKKSCVLSKKRTGRINPVSASGHRKPQSTDSESNGSSSAELGAPPLVETSVDQLHEMTSESISTSRRKSESSQSRASPEPKFRPIVKKPGRLVAPEIPTFVCPQCQDFEGMWADLNVHYKAMHSDRAVCVKCENSPCFHIVDFYKHVTQHHRGFDISECSRRRTDPKIIANDLVEQLGQISREKYGTNRATWFMSCELTNIKLSREGGASCARYVCKQCHHTSRSSETCFAHIATHLKIKSVHCLHCRYEGNLADMYHHYSNRHHVKRPDLLPDSLRHKRYQALVERIVDKLDNEETLFSSEEKKTSPASFSSCIKSENVVNEPPSADNDSSMLSDDVLKTEPRDYVDSVGVCVKQEIKEPSSDCQSESWTFYFFCPYCEHSGTSVMDYRLHVELQHARRNQSVGLAVCLTLPDAEVQAIQKAVSATRVTLTHAGKTIYQTDTNVDTQNVKLVPIPDGFQLHEIDTASFLLPYNTSMLALYNHFSILETVSVTGSHLSCHLCDVAQTSFPALFEHWNRAHLYIQPYICAFCAYSAKRPASIASHERRAHARDYGNKYVINQSLFNLLFTSMERLLKAWLVKSKVDSYVPDDWKLVIDPVVHVEDISKDVKYVKYFTRPASPSSSVTSSVTSTRSSRSRCKLP